MKFKSIVFLTFIFIASSVYAFFPTNTLTTVTLGQGKSHQKITEEAITDLYSEFFSISDITKPMKKAMENITDANAEVDEDQVSSRKHFDAENFEGGKQFILANKQVLIGAIQSGDVFAARFSLGQALHSIQDFYSHSNWVELGNTGTNTSLTRDSEAISNKAGPSDETCNDELCEAKLAPVCNDCSNNLVTPLLTSGYYSGEDRVKPTAVKKCSHGGPFDGSAVDPGPLSFTFGINKDYGDCLFSPHYHLHDEAAALGIEATKQFIRDIKDEITETQLKQLLGVGPTLAFVVDTTGSMGTIISNARAQIIQIINARLNTDEEPSKYIYAPFSDPSVGPVFKTDDANTFKSVISTISVNGGGDCPELSQSGIAQALSAVDNGGSIFMFTDATAKDASKAPFNASVASNKDIKVYSFLFGSCSPYDPSYFSLAEQSGGQVFILNTAEAGSITKLADKVTQSNAASILYISDSLDVNQKQFTIPVDTSIDELTFSISGDVQYSITNPSGSTITSTDVGIEVDTFGLGAVISADSPMAGSWIITLNGTGDFTLNVVADTQIDIDSFRYVEASGRPGHKGFYPIDGMPSTEGMKTYILKMSGQYQLPELYLIDDQGNQVAELPIAKGQGQSDNEYIGEADIQASNYRVYVRGEDLAGNDFQRMIPKKVVTQPISVAGPQMAQDLLVGESTDYTFTVTNFDANRTLVLSASDTKGYLSNVTPSNVQLDPGGTTVITVTLTVPSSSAANVSNSLILIARDATDPDVNNFASVNSTVVSEPILSDPITVSTSALSNGLSWTGYEDILLVDNGTAPYQWQIIDGSLPEGLTLNTETGEITGIPTLVGTSSFSIQVIDDEGSTSAPVTLSITVQNGLSLPPFNQINVYSTGSMSSTGGDVDGRLSVAGDVALTSFSIGEPSSSNQGLFSGGEAEISNSSIRGVVEIYGSGSFGTTTITGDVLSGGSLSDTGSGTINGDATAAGTILFDQSMSVTGTQISGATFAPQLVHEALSNYYNGVGTMTLAMGDTGVISDNGWGGLSINASSGVNVYTLDAQNLSDSGINNGTISKNIYSVNIQGELDSVIYINIEGSGNIELGGISWIYGGGITSRDVILNFNSDISSITLKSSNNTNILAPGSNIHFADGSFIDGGLVGKDLSGRVIVKGNSFRHDMN